MGQHNGIYVICGSNKCRQRQTNCAYLTMHAKLKTFQFTKYKLLLFAVKEMMFIASCIQEQISRYLVLFQPIAA